jgi:hypothetical protein
VSAGALSFELVGHVLTDGTVDVPLFGPPKDVRLSEVTENDKDAAIGFEGDHYFLHTASKRFVLKGQLSLGNDLALVIPGPLNTLEADLSAGAVVEGARLSGLSGTTIHLSREDKAAPATGPTVFQLSRAVRVGREIGFEYRLVMRSGTDLGVVRLPLASGEKVLEVSGTSGWRVENGELVLPTSGRTAEMTITGTLPKLESFSPDPRSGYEWLLIEADPEHRVTVTGDARQVDSAESPIPTKQPGARLFLMQKGQRLSASVTSLVSVEALAAVVRSHRRTVVLTPRGDLVADDDLAYENNGIDYLAYVPGGRPIYLATSGKAERIMRQGSGDEEVMVPLRTGSADVRVQSLAQAAVQPFVGKLELPMPSYALTSSRVDLTVGTPAAVVPLALLGGDRPVMAVDDGDAVAAVLGLGAGALAVRPGPETSPSRLRRLRILAGLVLAGLWFLWAPGYVLSLVAMGVIGFLWLMNRVLRGVARTIAIVLAVGALGILGLVGLASISMRASAPRDEYAYPEPAKVASPAPSLADVETSRAGGKPLDLPKASVLEGVTPVALPLPSYRHSLYASRELVTRDRPFKPTLVYVTNLALAPLGFLWLVGLAIVISAHRSRIADGYRWAREKLTPVPQEPEPAEKPAPAPAPPAPDTETKA